MKYIKRFENNNLEYNLLMLKSYISILKKSKKNYDIAITYLTIIYNLLIIQDIYPEQVGNYSINDFLDLDITINEDKIYDIFTDLYDPNSVIRNNVENFDRYNNFIKYICYSFNVWTEMLSEENIDILKMKKSTDKYNI